MSEIASSLNVNRCPQADYEGYPCYKCKCKEMPDEFRRCGHNVVYERGFNWWKNRGGLRNHE